MDSKTSEIVAAANLALTETLSLDVVLERLLDFVAALVPYDSANVMLREGPRLVVRAIRGYERFTDAAGVRGASFEYAAHPIFRALIEARQGVLIPDTRQHPDWQAHPGTEYVRSWIGVPLVAEQELVGLYALDKAEAGFFTPAHLRLTEELAPHAVVAVRNARLYAKERDARERVERLYAATRALSTTMDLEAVLTLILRELKTVVPYDSASVQELNGKQLAIIAAHGFPDLEAIRGLRLALGSGEYPNLEEVVRTRAPLVLADAWNSLPGFRRKPHDQAQVRSWLGVPLLFGARLIGVLTLDRREPGYYTAEHARVATAFAAQAATAMENARLFTEAKRELAERRKAEGALRETAERYQLLFESNPLPAWVYDTVSSRFLAVNDAAVESYGYTREEFLGLSVNDLSESPPSDPGAPVARQRRKDGSLVEVELTSEVVHLEDRPARLVIARDITERRRVEQLREDLTHTLVHDLRTPLTVVLGALEALESAEGPASERLRRSAREGAERLLAMVNQILEVNRLEEHAFPLDRQWVALDGAVADALRLVEPLAQASDVALVQSMPPALPPVWADRNVVLRVLQNLVGNAVKFAPPRGRVDVTARLAAMSVVISVSDTGPGVPEELRGRLFQKFARGPQKGRGTGLGLAFCRLAVEAHGGRIWASSEPGKGATFSFSLPMVLSPAGETPAA